MANDHQYLFEANIPTDEIIYTVEQSKSQLFVRIFETLSTLRACLNFISSALERLERLERNIS